MGTAGIDPKGGDAAADIKDITRKVKTFTTKGTEVTGERRDPC
jgi:hypothetical protein